MKQGHDHLAGGQLVGVDVAGDQDLGLVLPVAGAGTKFQPVFVDDVAAAAAMGTRLSSVMPGTVLASRQKGLPAG